MNLLDVHQTIQICWFWNIDDRKGLKLQNRNYYDSFSISFESTKSIEYTPQFGQNELIILMYRIP